MLSRYIPEKAAFGSLANGPNGEDHKRKNLTSTSMSMGLPPAKRRRREIDSASRRPYARARFNFIPHSSAVVSSLPPPLINDAFNAYQHRTSHNESNSGSAADSKKIFTRLRRPPISDDPASRYEGGVPLRSASSEKGDVTSPRRRSCSGAAEGRLLTALTSKEGPQTTSRTPRVASMPYECCESMMTATSPEAVQPDTVSSLNSRSDVVAASHTQQATSSTPERLRDPDSGATQLVESTTSPLQPQMTAECHPSTAFSDIGNSSAVPKQQKVNDGGVRSMDSLHDRTSSIATVTTVCDPPLSTATPLDSVAASHTLHAESQLPLSDTPPTARSESALTNHESQSRSSIQVCNSSDDDVEFLSATIGPRIMQNQSFINQSVLPISLPGSYGVIFIPQPPSEQVITSGEFPVNQNGQQIYQQFVTGLPLFSNSSASYPTPFASSCQPKNQEMLPPTVLLDISEDATDNHHIEASSSSSSPQQQQQHATSSFSVCNTIEDDDLEIVDETIRMQPLYYPSPNLRRGLNVPNVNYVSQNAFNASISPQYLGPLRPYISSSSSPRHHSFGQLLDALKTEATEEVVEVGPQFKIHPDHPAVLVEALIKKLSCPICYRTYRRKKSMESYMKDIILPRSKVIFKKSEQQLDEYIEIAERNLIILRKRKEQMMSQQGHYTTTTTTAHLLKELSDEVEKKSQSKANSETIEADETHSAGDHSKSEMIAPDVLIAQDHKDIVDDDHETTEICVGKCGHVYCKKCIQQTVKEKKKCPLCNQSLTLKQLYPLFL